MSLGVHYSCKNKRGATTTTKKKKKKAIQKILEQHSCLFSDREENPLLRSSSSPPPPPLSCFLFSGIAQSAILRQANEDFQKQLQQQLQEMDSSIFRFLPKMRREREIEGAAVVQFLRISSIKLLTSSSNKHSRKQACFHVCLFVCCCNCRSSKIRFVCFVFVCLAQSSDLQLLSSCFFFLLLLLLLPANTFVAFRISKAVRCCTRRETMHNNKTQSQRKCRSLGFFFFCRWCFRRRCRLLLLVVCFLLQFVEEDELPSD